MHGKPEPAARHRLRLAMPSSIMDACRLRCPWSGRVTRLPFRRRPCGSAAEGGFRVGHGAIDPQDLIRPCHLQDPPHRLGHTRQG